MVKMGSRQKGQRITELCPIDALCQTMARILNRQRAQRNQNTCREVA